MKKYSIFSKKGKQILKNYILTFNNLGGSSEEEETLNTTTQPKKTIRTRQSNAKVWDKKEILGYDKYIKKSFKHSVNWKQYSRKNLEYLSHITINKWSTRKKDLLSPPISFIDWETNRSEPYSMGALEVPEDTKYAVFECRECGGEPVQLKNGLEARIADFCKHLWLISKKEATVGFEYEISNLSQEKLNKPYYDRVTKKDGMENFFSWRGYNELIPGNIRVKLDFQPTPGTKKTKTPDRVLEFVSGEPNYLTSSYDESEDIAEHFVKSIINFLDDKSPDSTNPTGTLQMSFGVPLRKIKVVYENANILGVKNPDNQEILTKAIELLGYYKTLDLTTEAGGLAILCNTYILTIGGLRGIRNLEMMNSRDSNTGFKSFFIFMLRNSFSDLYQSLALEQKRIFIEWVRNVHNRILDEKEEPPYWACLWIPNHDRLTEGVPYNPICVPTIYWLCSIIDPENQKIRDWMEEQFDKSIAEMPKTKPPPSVFPEGAIDDAIGYAEFQLHRDYWFTRVNEDGLSLAEADDNIKRDIEIVLAAVTQNGEAIQFADESIKSNKKIVLAAVRNTTDAILHIDESFTKDKDILDAFGEHMKKMISD